MLLCIMSNIMLLLLMCIYIVVGESTGSVLKCRRMEKPKVYLLANPSQDLESFAQVVLMNAKFVEKCEEFYDIDNLRFGTTINETLKAIEEEQNVINLWVRDYYNYTFEEYNNDKLVYAGDIVYQSNSIPEPDMLDEELTLRADVRNNLENIKKQEKEKRIAKVVSNNVANINSGDLRDFIESIQYENSNNITSRLSCRRQATKITDLNIVLICYEENCFKRDKPYSETLEFIFKRFHECDNYAKIYQNNILAVLAPRPFEMEYEISIPTIFYETPYMNSEYKSQFPNSMNLISGLLLKHAFMKFINDAGWRRVAILSDVSPYSIEFEEAMLEMFQERQILFNIQRGENIRDLKKAYEYLISVDTRIIIANVNEENARRLENLMRPNIMKVTILFRVPPFWEFESQNWISITLGPSEFGYKSCNAMYKTSGCSGIMQGLNIVAKAHAKHSLPQKELHRKTFYRNVTETMISKIQPGATAHITRPFGEIISKMYISEHGKIDKVDPNNAPFDKAVLDQGECIAKVGNFSRPCDHAVYLYLMFVIIMFAITLLTITCYFHETSPLISKEFQQL